MSDKRKAARVQGLSWASKPKSSSSKSKSKDNNKGNQDSDNAGYKFDPKVQPESGPEPEIKPNDISLSGEYVLAKDKQGVPARINYNKSYLSPAEADALLDELNVCLPWQQRTGLRQSANSEQAYKEPRETCWFGLPYSYSRVVSWDATEDEDWPPQLYQLKERISNDTGVNYNSVFCNRYRTGKDFIGWHADDEPSLGKYTTIGSLSLGSTRIFELGDKKAFKSQQNAKQDEALRGADSGPSFKPLHRVFLEHGSLLVMEGSVQDLFVHRVPTEYHDRGCRINLTFRVIVNPPKQQFPQQSNQSVKLMSGDIAESGKTNHIRELVCPNLQIELLNFFFTNVEWHQPQIKENEENKNFLSKPLFHEFSERNQWPTIIEHLLQSSCSGRDLHLTKANSLVAYLLQKPSMELSWRWDKHESNTSIILLGQLRNFSMRMKKSVAPSYGLTDVSTALKSGDLLEMDGALHKRWTYSIRRDKGGHKHTMILVFSGSSQKNEQLTVDDGLAKESSLPLPVINLSLLDDENLEPCGHFDNCHTCQNGLQQGKSLSCPVCRKLRP